MNINIGKSKISIQVTGCIDCGSTGCDSWTIAKIIDYQINGLTYRIFVHRCGICEKKHPHTPFAEELL